MRRYLLERALERLPADHRDRYAQEWAADLAQLGRLRGIVWALGLCRAATRLARTFGHHPQRALPLRALPQAGLDGAALAAAYVFAYGVRFSDGVPSMYKVLLWQTVPFAAAGGLAILVAFGIYRHGAALLRLCQAVAVTALAIVGYAAVVQPTLRTTPIGYVPLLPPTGVLLLFAVLAVPALLVTRVRVSARLTDS
jgi:hypothetical protein